MKFAFLDLVNFSMLMTAGETDRQRQDQVYAVKLILSDAPLIVLKQTLIFQSGITMEGYRLASITKSILMLS